MQICRLSKLRDISGETKEIVERSSVNICCVEEIRFIGKSDRMISGKAAEYIHS